MKYLMCLISAALVACQTPTSELAQLSSTTNSLGNIAATWSETSGGATTDFVYRLHIHNGNSPAELNERTEILRTNNIVDTAVNWNSNDTLQIRCLRGDVYFWVNRSVIDGQNIRIELDSECPKNVQDQWTYFAPGTAVGTIPEVIANDPRVQKLLRRNGKITETSSGLRILHNTERTKEVIEVQHH